MSKPSSLELVLAVIRKAQREGRVATVEGITQSPYLSRAGYPRNVAANALVEVQRVGLVECGRVRVQEVAVLGYTLTVLGEAALAQSAVTF